MTVPPIPPGFRTVTPYIVVQGVAAMLEFVQKAFGAEVLERMPGPDSTVAHAMFRIGDSMLMCGEFREIPGMPKREYPAMIYFYVENMDEWYQRAVAAGATTLRPPTNEFYGDRVAGVLDAQGNQWWIATHVEDVPPDELARRAQARG